MEPNMPSPPGKIYVLAFDTHTPPDSEPPWQERAELALASLNIVEIYAAWSLYGPHPPDTAIAPYVVIIGRSGPPVDQS